MGCKAEVELVREDLPMGFSWGGWSLSLPHRAEGSSMCGDIEKAPQRNEDCLRKMSHLRDQTLKGVLLVTAQQRENPREVKPSNQYTSTWNYCLPKRGLPEKRGSAFIS